MQAAFPARGGEQRIRESCTCTCSSASAGHDAANVLDDADDTTWSSSSSSSGLSWLCVDVGRSRMLSRISILWQLSEEPENATGARATAQRRVLVELSDDEIDWSQVARVAVASESADAGGGTWAHIDVSSSSASPSSSSPSAADDGAMTATQLQAGAAHGTSSRYIRIMGRDILPICQLHVYELEEAAARLIGALELAQVQTLAGRMPSSAPSTPSRPRAGSRPRSWHHGRRRSSSSSAKAAAAAAAEAEVLDAEEWRLLSEPDDTDESDDSGDGLGGLMGEDGKIGDRKSKAWAASMRSAWDKAVKEMPKVKRLRLSSQRAGVVLPRKISREIVERHPLESQSQQPKGKRAGLWEGDAAAAVAGAEPLSAADVVRADSKTQRQIDRLLRTNKPIASSRRSVADFNALMTAAEQQAALAEAKKAALQARAAAALKMHDQRKGSSSKSGSHQSLAKIAALTGMSVEEVIAAREEAAAAATAKLAARRRGEADPPPAAPAASTSLDPVVALKLKKSTISPNLGKQPPAPPQLSSSSSSSSSWWARSPKREKTLLTRLKAADKRLRAKHKALKRRYAEVVEREKATQSDWAEQEAQLKAWGLSRLLPVFRERQRLLRRKLALVREIHFDGAQTITERLTEIADHEAKLQAYSSRHNRSHGQKKNKSGAAAGSSLPEGLNLADDHVLWLPCTEILARSPVVGDLAAELARVKEDLESASARVQKLGMQLKPHSKDWETRTVHHAIRMQAIYDPAKPCSHDNPASSESASFSSLHAPPPPQEDGNATADPKPRRGSAIVDVAAATDGSRSGGSKSSPTASRPCPSLLSPRALELFLSVATDQRNKHGRLIAAYALRMEKARRQELGLLPHKGAKPGRRGSKSAADEWGGGLPPPSVVGAFVDYFCQSIAFEYGLTTREAAEQLDAEWRKMHAVRRSSSADSSDGDGRAKSRLRRSGSRAAMSASPLELATALELLIEATIFFSIKTATTASYEATLVACRDARWQEQVRWARQLPPSQLGVKKKYLPKRDPSQLFEDTDVFSAGTAALSSMQQCEVPSDLLHTVLHTVRLLHDEAVLHAVRNGRKEKALDAENFLPIMIYAAVQADLDVHRVLKFAELFAMNNAAALGSESSGEAAYYMTNLQAAVYWIMSLKPVKLLDQSTPLGATASTEISDDGEDAASPEWNMRASMVLNKAIDLEDVRHRGARQRQQKPAATKKKAGSGDAQDGEGIVFTVCPELLEQDLIQARREFTAKFGDDGREGRSVEYNYTDDDERLALKDLEQFVRNRKSREDLFATLI